MSTSATRRRQDGSRQKSDFLNNLLDLTIPQNERATEAKRSLFNFDYKKQSKKNHSKKQGDASKCRTEPIRTPSPNKQTSSRASRVERRLPLTEPVRLKPRLSKKVVNSHRTEPIRTPSPNKCTSSRTETRLSSPTSPVQEPSKGGHKSHKRRSEPIRTPSPNKCTSSRTETRLSSPTSPVQEPSKGGYKSHKRRSEPIRTPSPKKQTSSKTEERLQLPAPIVGRDMLADVTVQVENSRVQNDENVDADTDVEESIVADTDETDEFVTFNICDDPMRYLELRNNQGIFVSFSEEELKTCASIILQQNFNYRSAADGVDFGGFLQTGHTVSSKMGLFKLAPKTVKPYEFTQGHMEIVMWVIQGKCVFRSTAYYVSNGVKYIHGENVKSGDVFVIPPKCAYTFENWSDENCLFGFTSMTHSETPTQ